MTQQYRNTLFFLILFLLLITGAVLHLFAGQIEISFHDFYQAIFHFDPTNTNHIIAVEFRFTRLIMAILAGSALSIAGMLMQTLFNNPLAGPYVLGINSGSSLLVALTLMTGVSFFQHDLSIILSALLGALIFGFLILSFSFFVKNNISLLLIGLMLGSFTGAIVTLLQTFSNAQNLKVFTMWTLGTIQQTEMQQIPLILIFYFIGILSCIFLIKPLNSLVLGENASLLLGINLKSLRISTIAITAVLTGLITAFCGPIAFVGLAVPNITRIVFKTQNHGLLLFANLFFGALFLIFCDIIIQYLEPVVSIPINAFTSLIGAPLVILILLKKLK